MVDPRHVGAAFVGWLWNAQKPVLEKGVVDTEFSDPRPICSCRLAGRLSFVPHSTQAKNICLTQGTHRAFYTHKSEWSSPKSHHRMRLVSVHPTGTHNDATNVAQA